MRAAIVKALGRPPARPPHVIGLEGVGVVEEGERLSRSTGRRLVVGQ